MKKTMTFAAVLSCLALLAGTAVLHAQHRHGHAGARSSGSGSSYRGSSYRGASYRGSSYRGSSYRGASYSGSSSRDTRYKAYRGSSSTRPYRSPDYRRGSYSTYKKPYRRASSTAPYRAPRAPQTVKAPGGGRIATTGYAVKYGTKLRSGHFAYKGFKHRHWTHKWYSRAWRCWLWYDPCTFGWFYWCGDRDHYLPVRYITVCAPTVSEEASPGGETEQPPESEETPEAAEGEGPDLPDLPEPE